MKTSLFPTYHPVVCMGYFAAVICLTFCAPHPVYVALGLLASTALAAYLKGTRNALRSLAWALPLVLFVALLNGLFNTTGTTRLFQLGPVGMTWEGLCYGACAGGMLACVLMWFSSYNEVITEDKFTYLFGRALPTLSLALSMVSRWVPRMVARGRSVHDSQESLVGAFDPSAKGAYGRGVRMATVLAGLGLEDSIQTSDSMRARGYGAARRTSYARYAWHAREKAMAAALAVLAALNIACFIAGSAAFTFYPRLNPIGFEWAYVAYAALLALPFAAEAERLRIPRGRGGKVGRVGSPHVPTPSPGTGQASDAGMTSERTRP